MVLDERQKQVGKDNFADAVRFTRRQMLTGALAVPSAAGMYYGYEHLKGGPVKTAIIGTGNQGCQAHIGQSNPDFIEFVAFSDIRPSNVARARGLFRDKYGSKAEKIKHYYDYRQMIDETDAELIIVALPLFLHEPATLYALSKGKHVLCEKLMAGTVTACKNMVNAADKAGRFLAIGHQRHYSYLYANARSIIEQKILGDIRHIRACWHRNQTINAATGEAGAPDAEKGLYDGWYPPIPDVDKTIDIAKFGKGKDEQYESVNQLVRWRIDPKTGGGLMVELGSHQLDACSIFLHAAAAQAAGTSAEHAKHVLPVAVQGAGPVSYFKDGRQMPDHVFLVYEYGEDVNKAVVMYSSISTNTFDGYGEQVMGTKGTLILNQEAEAYLFRENADKNTRITWAEARVTRPMAAAGSTKQWGGGTAVADTITSRGYREEQEHMAWLIQNVKTPDPAKPELMPRCNGRIAMNDAVVTLVSNLAMKHSRRVAFKPEWFDPASPAVPETDPAVVGKA
jgi:predicted dehydrogenase